MPMAKQARQIWTEKIGLVHPSPSVAGVENVSDHGTIGLRKFLGLPENILCFRSKKEVLTRHKDKFLIGRKYIELKNDKN